jgi:hypothetical protein
MNSLTLRLSTIAILSIAIATPAFGGRMLESAAPPELPRATSPEATEAPITDVDDEGEEPTKDPDMIPESAEGSDDDLPVEATPASPPSRWKWKRSLSLGVSADDNVYLSSTHKQSDVIFTLGGNFQLLWGLKKEESYLAIDYSPSVIVFADHSRANAFDQKVGVGGQWRIAKLTLGVQAGAQSLSGSDTDVGGRANRSLWQVSLQAKYDYSTKTSFEVNLAPNAADYSHYLDSIEWTNSNWIDYQVFPKTRVGAGLTFGYLKPAGSSAQTYQEALVRITNPMSGKLTVNASGGVQYRQLGSGGGTQTTPVFRVGASYQPFDGTAISVDASRRIYSSAATVGQNFAATGGTVSVRQRLFKRVFATVAGGYEDATYQSTESQGGTSRHDQYVFVRPSVSFEFRKWVNLELYYQYRSNTSTAAFSAFDSNIAGLQAAISF